MTHIDHDFIFGTSVSANDTTRSGDTMQYEACNYTHYVTLRFISFSEMASLWILY